MYLTASNLAHNLIAQGLITAESVVDGDFTVLEAGRRNRNFKLIRQRSPGLFIKQVQSSTPEAVMTLQREAAFYQLINTQPALARLAELAPRFVAFDPPTYTLTVELLPQAESLTEYHMQQGDYPEAVGELIGQALGAFHAQPAQIPAEPPGTALFPRRMPWILAIDPTTLAPLSDLGNVGRQMAALLLQQPAFFQQLLALRYEWQWDSLIHGDLKWDNFVIFRDADGKQGFRIVDWELVDVGDAAWDVGAVFATYLAFWAMTVPLVPEQPPEQAFLAASPSLARMRAPLRRFWQTYSATRGLQPDVARRYLARCMRFCAGRLVLSVFEFLYNAQQVNVNALAMLQMSHNIFLAPDRAAAELLEL